MYTDIPGQIKNTMKDKLKKKIGGGGDRGPKPHHKLTKIITFKEKVLKVLIWKNRCKQNLYFKISIKAPNKL